MKFMEKLDYYNYLEKYGSHLFNGTEIVVVEEPYLVKSESGDYFQAKAEDVELTTYCVRWKPIKPRNAKGDGDLTFDKENPSSIKEVKRQIPR
jgi:hypothetical protein